MLINCVPALQYVSKKSKANSGKMKMVKSKTKTCRTGIHKKDPQNLIKSPLNPKKNKRNPNVNRRNSRIDPKRSTQIQVYMVVWGRTQCRKCSGLICVSSAPHGNASYLLFSRKIFLTYTSFSGTRFLFFI